MESNYNLTLQNPSSSSVQSMSVCPTDCLSCLLSSGMALCKLKFPLLMCYSTGTMIDNVQAVISVVNCKEKHNSSPLIY